MLIRPPAERACTAVNWTLPLIYLSLLASSGSHRLAGACSKSTLTAFFFARYLGP
jgi:hypothetical protein